MTISAHHFWVKMLLSCQDPSKLKLDRSKQEILGNFVNWKMHLQNNASSMLKKMKCHRARVDHRVVVIVSLQDPVGALGVWGKLLNQGLRKITKSGSERKITNWSTLVLCLFIPVTCNAFTSRIFIFIIIRTHFQGTGQGALQDARDRGHKTSRGFCRGLRSLLLPRSALTHGPAVQIWVKIRKS